MGIWVLTKIVQLLSRILHLIFLIVLCIQHLKARNTGSKRSNE